MRYQSSIFSAIFLITGVPIGALIYRDLPLGALLIGGAGLLLHWILSRRGPDDGEAADASYFLGFLLTLTILAVGLYKLGVPPSAGNAGGGATGSVDQAAPVLGFLEDLAAGLVLTIVGLAIRQARTLAAPAAPEEAAMLETQRRLAATLEAFIHLWRNRPEHQVLKDLEDTRTHAREAAVELEQSVATAARGMLAAVRKLEDTVSEAAAKLQHATSSLGGIASDTTERLAADARSLTKGLESTLTESTEAISKELRKTLQLVEQQRQVSSAALADAQAAATTTRAEAEERLQQQVTLWRTALDRGTEALDQAHTTLDGEYVRGLKAFNAAGTAFSDLSVRTVGLIETLPDPAVRLAGLWNGIAALEGRLTGAVEGSAGQFELVRDRAETAARALEQLGSSTATAASSIEASGGRLGEGLQTELQQMNQIIEDYVGLLEQTTRRLPVTR